MNIAISGFGRIGRAFLRTVLLDERARKKLHIVAINIGPARKEWIAHLFKYDTLMGVYPGSVHMDGSDLVVDDHRIALLATTNPAILDWAAYQIDWVVECSGKFTKRDDAARHLQVGARHVLISAPATDEDISIVPGVNDTQFDQHKHKIVSLGSCTTNAFLPLLHILHEAFVIERGMMTTVHAYTNSQVLLDVEGNDLRTSRAAALNIIPTSSGAAKMIEKLVPGLGDHIAVTAVRVPVGKVSLIDFAFVAQKKLSIDRIHDIVISVSENRMNGIIGFSMIPLVSSDFAGDSRSVVVDGLLTHVTGNMAKIFGWYDNEWGYSTRLKDFLLRAHSSAVRAAGS